MFSGSENHKRWTSQCLLDTAHSGQGLHTIKPVSVAWSQSYRELTLLGKAVSFLLVCGSWWVNHTPVDTLIPGSTGQYILK